LSKKINLCSSHADKLPHAPLEHLAQVMVARLVTSTPHNYPLVRCPPSSLCRAVARSTIFSHLWLFPARISHLRTPTSLVIHSRASIFSLIARQKTTTNNSFSYSPQGSSSLFFQFLLDKLTWQKYKNI
jgi:hypothetical protein